jgi:nucleotide sugar dehydrogenase
MKIAVVGIGKLGLCLSLNLAESGFDVIGMDNNQKYITSLINKTFISNEPFVNEMLATNHLDFTTCLSYATKDAAIVFIAVDTPSLKNGNYDHSKIDSLLNELSHKNIVIVSTVMPGYCNSKNRDNISYSPQLIAQGSIINDQKNPNLVIIGKSTPLLESIYQKIHRNKPKIIRMDNFSAEIVKISLNCFITTKIAFANYIGDICHKVNCDPNEVLSAIGNDPRVGNSCFKYGYGYGGPCFPRDNNALKKFAESIEMNASINIATDVANREHIMHQLYLIEHQNILPYNIVKINNEYEIFDVGYKPNSCIIQDSQALCLALELSKIAPVTIKTTSSIAIELQEKFPNKFRYKYED